MRRTLKKLVGGFTAASMILASLAQVNTSVPANTMTAHVIEAGDSWEGNPLKGFVPYNYGTMEFPYSLEWFYIGVNEVQTGMNEFNWTALERLLDDVASRGHQAVMRFYYDTPGEEPAVPQFLIDQGLEMKYYNEPDALGGDGYAPDYSDANFRQSMQNFIKAFGDNYDGDGRLAFITVGLLGFWGEWHNWPYDEDTSDGKADWSIPTVVYKEVLDAFDGAFDITPFCAREPKSGIDFNNYDVGFHDDSFLHATLSQSNGGQSWSFMQKMKNFGQENRWKTNCIGGEIYPPLQYSIFGGNTAYYDTIQDWDKCMEETHATWLMDDAMRYYSGNVLEEARKAAVGMGYDFRVSTAYYSDVVNTNSISLGVDIKNIGCAPFYYDHRTWPIEIGVKQNGNIVKSWRTDWNLCDIPADESNVSFNYNIANHGLSNGNYSIVMRVVNPVAGGNILGFANAGQGSDGWLDLGTIQVAVGSEETEKQTEAESEPETETESCTVIPSEPETETERVVETTPAAGDIPVGTKITAWETEDSLICDVVTSTKYEHLQIYIDGDNNGTTGFIDYSGIAPGFEILVENQYLSRHYGNDSEWSSWVQIGSGFVSTIDINNGKRVTISKEGMGSITQGAKLIVKLVDSSWTVVETTDVVEITELETETCTQEPSEPETETQTETESQKKPEVTTEKQTEKITEAATEEVPTEQETETTDGVLISSDMHVLGYQVSMTAEGMRTVYSYNSTVEGQEIEDVGLIYGVDIEGFDKADMVADSTNEYVKMYAGTEEYGRLNKAMSLDKTYVMTMKFVGSSVEEYTTKFYTRAYAKLKDGSYAYSKIMSFTIFDIAEELYTGALMQTSEGHNYLYTRILSVVDKEYPIVEYGWSPVVKPGNGE